MNWTHRALLLGGACHPVNRCGAALLHAPTS